MKKSRILKQERSVDFFNKLFTLLSKISFIAGGLLVLIYCLHIKRYPAGTQVGDTVFFLFVIGAFGIIYGLMMLYGSVSMLWFVTIIDKVIKILGGTPYRQLYPELRSKFWFFTSILTFLMIGLPIVFILTKIQWTSALFQKVQLVGMVLACGFCLLVTMGTIPVKSIPINDGRLKIQSSDLKKGDDNLRWLVSILLFFTPLLYGTNLITLLDICMVQIGIRDTNVTIEVNRSDYFKIKESADKLKLSMTSCKSSHQESYYVSGVDILWQGIGETTFIEIAEKNKEGSSNEKKFGLGIKSNDLSVIRYLPTIKYC